MTTTAGSIARVPLPSARAIGLVYLLYFIVAIVPLPLTRGIVIPGDITATAAAILAHESAWRTAIALNLLGNIVYVVLAVLLYCLFADRHRMMSLLAALLAVVGATVQIVALLLQVAPLVLLRDAQITAALGTAQVQAAALLSLRLYNQFFAVSFVIFAMFDFVIGLLIYRSRFVPRPIGVLMMLAGIGWATFLWPPLAAAVMPAVVAIGALAELVLMVWLIAKGVDIERWREALRSG